jgi:HlyD family secretion protein
VRAPVLFLIADLRQMEVRIDVSEIDIGKINIGQKVSMSVSAYPERKFSAEVHDIRLSSEIGKGPAVYKVILRIDNSEQLIRPGMTARAEIIVRQIDDALLVPNAALNFQPVDSGKGVAGFLQRFQPSISSAQPPAKQNERDRPQRVWILRDGAPVSAPVIVGATDGRRTEILNDGVVLGQAIITNTRTHQSLRGP